MVLKICIKQIQDGSEICIKQTEPGSEICINRSKMVLEICIKRAFYEIITFSYQLTSKVSMSATSSFNSCSRITPEEEKLTEEGRVSGGLFFRNFGGGGLCGGDVDLRPSASFEFRDFDEPVSLIS